MAEKAKRLPVEEIQGTTPAGSANGASVSEAQLAADARERETAANRSSDLAIDAVRRDLVLSLATRVFLLLVGVVCATSAIVYTWRNADDIVRDAGADLFSEQVLALLLPIMVFVGLGVVAGATAWMVHSRGLDETYRALDTASRIRREAEVAVSARGLVHSFEEKLQSTHRAFTLLLWLGRTVFVVCLGLFVVAVLDGIFRGIDPYTVALGATSIVGALLGVLKNVPERVENHLVDVIQIQTIVTGFHRQISLLESYAFDAKRRRVADPARALEAQRAIDQAVERAARRIARIQEANREGRDGDPARDGGDPALDIVASSGAEAQGRDGIPDPEETGSRSPAG